MKSIVLVSTNFNIVYKDAEAKIDNIDFSSKTSLLDYDIAVIGINRKIILEYYSYNAEQFSGYKLIDQSKSRDFINDLERRKIEINSLLATGKNVYFILGDEFKCVYHTYKQSVSGTGRNARTTNYVEEMDIAQYLLNEEKIKIISSEGKNVDILPNTKLSFIYYKAYFNCKFFEPAITTTNAGNIISGIAKSCKGYKVILPELVNQASYDKKRQNEYLNDVEFVLQNIRTLDDSLSQKCEIPLWVNNCILSNEKADVLEIDKIEKQIQKLITMKNKVQLTIDNNFKYKKLLYSSGTELEDITKTIFEELGFEILPSRPNRSDLNLKYNDNCFVCEVKGLTKSAGEKNSNQLQKWETEFFEDYDIHPKQVLIVNTFRNLPLKERVEDSFPIQMLPYATKKEQCLITTTQLLCFYLNWLDNNDILENFIDKITSTNGIFDEYNDWGKYIEETK